MEKKEMKDLERRMEGALSKLKSEFAALRAGRASAGMLDPVQVEAYGQKMPIAQLGTVQVPEPRLLTVQVWDAGQVALVEKALRESGLGFNPQTEGQLIRIPIPSLNEERREELRKAAGKYAEATRVAVRNVRRDGVEKVRALEKDKAIGKDEAHGDINGIQSLTDKMIADIDTLLTAKEKEVMQP